MNGSLSLSLTKNYILLSVNYPLRATILVGVMLQIEFKYRAMTRDLNSMCSITCLAHCRQGHDLEHKAVSIKTTQSIFCSLIFELLNEAFRVLFTTYAIQNVTSDITVYVTYYSPADRKYEL